MSQAACILPQAPDSTCVLLCCSLCDKLIFLSTDPLKKAHSPPPALILLRNKQNFETASILHK